jgi:hypothetical protein
MILPAIVRSGLWFPSLTGEPVVYPVLDKKTGYGKLLLVTRGINKPVERQ